MTDALIVKIEQPLTLATGDYLIVTVDVMGRARYKHLPAELATIIQKDATRKTSKGKRALGPVLRGLKRTEFVDKVLTTIRTPLTFAAIQKKLPDYRTGQLYALLAQLIKNKQVRKVNDTYLAN